MLIDTLKDVPVGTRIWFKDEVRPYHVKARSWRYLVCTKPFNIKHTVLYTVVDLAHEIRGTENLIFGAGAETTYQCEAMIERLMSEDTEVSHKNRVDLDVTRIAPKDTRKRRKK